MFAFIIFSGVALCAGANAALPQKVANHIMLSAEGASDTNSTGGGLSNAAVVAIGGAIGVILFIAIILLNTIRKRRKKGIQ